MNLNTERLLLREFVPGDWQDVLAYQSDPTYLRFYPWTERRPDEVQAFVQRFVAWRLEWPRTKYQLAVQVAGEDAVIGTCGVRMEGATARDAEMGYEIAPDHWRHGYATEAARAMLAFAFAELKLHRVWAQCIADNVASARVLEKVGMQREGRLREHQWFKGRWWDSLIYSLLEQEWPGR